VAATAISRVGNPTILVVDDEPSMLRYLRTLLELEAYNVETATSAAEALRRLERDPIPDLVLLDVLMPEVDGIQALQRARSLHPNLKVVMLSCVSDARKVAQAIKLGARDYLTKPLRKSDLDQVIREALNPVPEQPAPAEPEVSSPAATSPAAEDSEIVELSEDISFVCASPAMKKIRSQAALIAAFDIPVLLLGESGTGKEVVSMLVHKLSPRANQPFLKVNCAAVPADLLESELFGYEAGAFTGATKSKPGKFEQCDKGTILLDEIGEMPPALQAKLLHVLQDRTFSRLGSRSIVKVDVRVIAATNINIEEAIASKKLREDLYYRLNGFTMHLPPLRERRKEIPLLLKHFMNRMAERYARPPAPFTPRLMEACLRYSWPGNLRELEKFVTRYLILGEEDLAIAELEKGDRGLPPDPATVTSGTGGGLKNLARSVKHEAEAEAIAQALEQTGWHRQRAAALLKISYKALLYKIRQYNLRPPERA